MKFPNLISRRFLVHIFLSLLLTGLIQVVLLGVFTMLFSSRLINETYSEQSMGRMDLLVDKVNTSISSYREISLRLSKNEIVEKALFTEKALDKGQLSLLYENLYKELAGRIDDASVHLINNNGKHIFSSHVLPAIYNPNSSDQSLSTYVKLKSDRETFPMVDSFVNPKGDRVALSLFRSLKGPGNQSGFIITDINTGPLGQILENINAGFFSNIYLLDNINYKFSSLFRVGETGNFADLGWQIPSGKSGVLIIDNTLIAYGSLYPDELVLAATLTIGTVKANLSLLTRMILIISIIGLILSSLLAFGLAKNISHPVTSLVEAMKKMEKGDLTVQIEKFREDEFEILFHGFNQMSSQIQQLMDSRVAREKALRTAERKALQSQINPHFLYNTLNTIKAISKLKGVEEITTIVTQLGKLLRNSIDSAEEFTTVGDSLNLVEAYLQIQKIRYGNNFNWNIEVEKSLLELIIPRLIIQPIVENSVIHGLETLTGDKMITIRSSESPPQLHICDNGGSLTRELWNKSINGDKGVGLSNVEKRLKLYYGQTSGLSFTRKENLTIVTITLGSQEGIDK
jgi:two-component system sensor histidine kinase YesM